MNEGFQVLTQQLQNLQIDNNPPLNNHLPHNKPPPPRHHPRNRPNHPPPIYEVGSEDDFSNEEPRRRRRRPKSNDNDRGLHLEMPEFEESLNPEDFEDCLNSMERILEFKEYTNEKKCKVIIFKFKKYANIWWKNIRNQREREGKERIRT
ncbi:hypothetical protein CFOL_v3_28556 [Cephalotus follicularis]|uniref:Uncharacterized protein n=1 Tax=Cephalotus follicularis TaxID=3775 RepID=A0A1Q3CYF4_CEPFO|nr:hypothetical protein CFOL_v3_28555 [Cephalotus follicularis]GAV85118.1 hypothetical protein CFOL_v3_28556 [Cephalotus follicularis]